MCIRDSAQAAFGDTFLDQPGERPLVGDGPGDGLAEAVDACLVVGLDDRQCLARAGEDLVEFLLLLGADGLHGFDGCHGVLSSM